MNNEYENDDVIDDDISDEEDEQDEDDVEDEEEEESPLETIVKEILEEHRDCLKNYVSDPSNPEEVSENDKIKKFIQLKVRAKIMESFECKQQWESDKQLKKLFQATKKAMKKDAALEEVDALRHVLKRNSDIADLIEQLIEEEMDEEEETIED